MRLMNKIILSCIFYVQIYSNAFLFFLSFFLLYFLSEFIDIYNQKIFMIFMWGKTNMYFTFRIGFLRNNYFSFQSRVYLLGTIHALGL